MQRPTATGLRALSVFLLVSTGVIGLRAQEAVPGETLDPATYGPSYIESLDAAIIRDRLAPTPVNDKVRQPGEHGVWMVPTLAATRYPHSGIHNAINKWGDTRMGIGFPRPADVQGAYIAGQAASGAWTPAVRAVGYLQGEKVAETPWFDQISAEPQWLAMNLHNIDRLEIVSQPVLNGGGWYGLDDLTFTLLPDPQHAGPQAVVVDFEDLPYGYKLTGSNYRDLIWEAGRGDFVADEGVHGPRVPPDYKRDTGADREPVEPSGTRAVGPDLISTFRAVKKGDAGSQSYPPDTCGAIGPNHYLETVNRNFAVYNKTTGEQITNILLGSFLPGSNGDPRVLFDQYSGRWFVIVCDFDASATIYLAVSLTDDPLSMWFKTSFVTAAGSDAGKWPDYPTLGVDANGLYTAAYMVGFSSTMTIFAINKAPLVGSQPSLGTITAFRNLPFEGAIQPAHTFGTATGEYLASYQTATRLRVRRVNPPLTGPTLTEVGAVTVPSYSDPPDAPALGSSTPLDTVDSRLMMALYRNGSLWTCHTISVGGRAGCRWYEINAAAHTLVQSGTVADSTRYYFFPSLMVNQAGHVALAFTGSSASQYASCYFTGRKANDPLGEMAPPQQYQAGTAAQNNIDGYGRNRWGDYSYTTLDPTDRTTIWTIQEYGFQTDVWGTFVATLRFSFPDCNGNGVDDACDISCGAVDGPCDVPGCGGSLDCDGNGIPDECDGARLGDMNCDGVIDFDDINPFVLALTGQTQYQAAYPNCRWLNADCNVDCAVDFDDINAFVALLSR